VPTSVAPTDAATDPAGVVVPTTDGRPWPVGLTGG